MVQRCPCGAEVNLVVGGENIQLPGTLIFVQNLVYIKFTLVGLLEKGDGTDLTN